PAGLGHHEMVNVRVHRDWTACAAVLGERRFALTTRATPAHTAVAFQSGDALVFGPEAAGLSDDFVATFPADRRVRIPMVAGNRSLNLSNAVAVTVYE